MINLAKTVAHLNIPTDSPSRAIQAVRGRLSRATSERAGGVDFVKALLDIDVQFADGDEARIASFALIQNVLKNNCIVDDAESAVEAAKAEAKRFLAEASNSWMFVKAGAYNTTQATEQLAVLDGVETKVDVKADGSLGRGAKKILAIDLYNREAAKGPVENSVYVGLLMKELGMTKLGARTYAYNVKKELGI